MSPELILVTGAYGYVGSHVVHQLLEKGYRVRGTARGAKVDLARKTFASYGDKFEVVNVPDLATDDISDHLVGVSALIHTAAPLPSSGDQKFILRGAIEGSVNVIRQAAKGGVKKIVYTSSIAAVMNPSGSLTENSWNPMTYEQALEGSLFAAYTGAKALSEKAVWELVDTYKDLDVTSFCPPFIFGPFVPGFYVEPNDYPSLSTTKSLYRYLTPKFNFPPFSGYIDVRDVARAHVAALNSPPESAIGRKRLPMASPHDLNYKKAHEYIAEKRPELKSRLVNINEVPIFPLDRMIVDLERVEQVTGVKVDSYIPWQDTILDTIDALIKIEKEWAAKEVV